MMMTTKIKKTLFLCLFFALSSLGLLLLSKAVYASFTVSALSGALVAIGSLYAYSTMIRQRTQEVEFDDSKDVIDTMDDPYDLYEDERENEIEDVKAMIKEEKARQKNEVLKNTLKNGSAWVSLYRLLPYAFLILGFLGLQNNHSLVLLPYLVGLGVGIIGGYLLAREWFI
jgi:hypothetical protein